MLVGSDDQLAASRMRHSMLIAESIQPVAALDAEARLQ